MTRSSPQNQDEAGIRILRMARSQATVTIAGRATLTVMTAVKSAGRNARIVEMTAGTTVAMTAAMIIVVMTAGIAAGMSRHAAATTMTTTVSTSTGIVGQRRTVRGNLPVTHGSRTAAQRPVTVPTSGFLEQWSKGDVFL